MENFPVGAGRSPLAVLHIRTSDVERMLMKLIEGGYASHEYSKTSSCFSGKGREQQCVNDSTIHSLVKDYYCQHAICHQDPFSLPREFFNVSRQIITTAVVVWGNLTPGNRLECN